MWNEQAERLQKLLKGPPPRTPEAQEALIRAYEDVSRALGEEIERSHEERRQALEAAAGPRAVEALARGAEAVREGLAAPEPAVRRLALFLAEDHHPEILTEATLRRIIATDPDVELRSSALCDLACQYEGTRDPAVGSFFAGVVSASGEPERVRLAAYWALIYLQGPTGRRPPNLFQMRFPEDVDWSLVARYLPGADAGRSAS